MGKGNCCACGKKLGIRGIMLKGGAYACFDCVKASGHNPYTWIGNLGTSAEEFNNEIEARRNGNADAEKGKPDNWKDRFREKMGVDTTFKATKAIGNVMKIDEENHLWYVQDQMPFRKSGIHRFDEIIDFELLEDGNSITKGGLGSAAIGALTFGGAGAIVGGITGKKTTRSNCTSMRIKITLNSISSPVEYINLINSRTNKNSSLYKSSINQAQEILSVLQVICNLQSENKAQAGVSVADELQKLKTLQDQGVITKEEFEVQKEKLLKL